MKKLIQKVIFANWPAFIALFLGFYYVVFELVQFDFAYLPGDLGDTRFNLYILEHFYRYFFVGDVPSSSYWDAPFMYPQEATISFSDNLLGTAPIYAFYRLLGYSLFGSFQMWFFTITIINFFATYLFCKRVTRDKYAGAIGALVFSFSVALIAQYSHAQTFARFPIPLAFYFCLSFYQSLQARYFFLTILMVVYQYYCALYLGFMLMIPVGIMLVLVFIFKWRQLSSHFTIKWLSQMLTSLAVNSLLLAPLIIPYLNSPAMVMEDGTKRLNSYHQVFETIPTLKSFLFVHNDTYLWNFLSQVGTDLFSWWDHQLFLGITVLASLSFLFLYGIKCLMEKRTISRQKILLSITGVITFILFLRVGDFSFYQYLHPLPGFGSMRAIHRIINIELLFFGLAVALVYSIVFRNQKQRFVAFPIVLLVFFTDNFIHSSGYYRFEKQEAVNRLSNLEKEYKVGSGDVISYEPIAPQEPMPYYHLDAMLFAQSKGLSVVNAYTSTVPGGYHFFAVDLNENGRKIWFQKNNVEKEPLVIHEHLSDQLKNYIKAIENNPEWLNKVQEQADERGYSLRRNILENAIWMVNQKKEKN